MRPVQEALRPRQRALAAAGIINLRQLAKFTEAEIKALHGIGPNALKGLHAALAAKGRSFCVATSQKK